jgi:hypothetical protein
VVRLERPWRLLGPAEERLDPGACAVAGSPQQARCERHERKREQQKRYDTYRHVGSIP